MKLLGSILVLALFSLNVATAEKHSFEGYKVVRLLPTSRDHAQFISKLQDNHDFDLLDTPRSLNEYAYVLLSPEAYLKYRQMFIERKLENQVVDNNFQKAIDAEQESIEKRKRRDVDSKNIVGKFARYTEILNFIDEIVLNNPTIASSYIAGTTFENRQIKTLVLKTATSNRGIFIDCGIHAREWIAISSCVWFIDQLVKNYNDGDEEATKLLNKYEVHIIPLVNSDGYEYSHTTFRMWRKNRNPIRSNCVGVDVNRNFGYKWLTGGSSSTCSSDIYAGPSADSELETKAIQKAINAKLGYWDAYFTIHTYGNFWSTSWSYAVNVYPPDYADLIRMAQLGVDAIKSVTGTLFTAGHSGVNFGALSGVSDDWAKGTANIKYAHTLELAPGPSSTDPDWSFYFTLPEDRAPRVGKDLYAGLTAFINNI